MFPSLWSQMCSMALPVFQPGMGPHIPMSRPHTTWVPRRDYRLDLRGFFVA